MGKLVRQVTLKPGPDSIRVWRRATELLGRRVGQGPQVGMGNLTVLFDDLGRGGPGTPSAWELAEALRQARADLGLSPTGGAALFEPKPPLQGGEQH